jgi:fibronectin-binding autotransporter adhesin
MNASGIYFLTNGFVNRPHEWRVGRKWHRSIYLFVFFASGLIQGQSTFSANSQSSDWSNPNSWDQGQVPGSSDIARFPNFLIRDIALGPAEVWGVDIPFNGTAVTLRNSLNTPLVLREHPTQGAAFLKIFSETPAVLSQLILEPLSNAAPKRSALYVEGEVDLTLSELQIRHGHLGAPPNHSYPQAVFNVEPAPGHGVEQSTITLFGSVWQPAHARGIFHLSGSRMRFFQDIEEDTGEPVEHFIVFEGEIHGTGGIMTHSASAETLLWQGGVSSYSGDSILGNQVSIHLDGPNLLSPNSRWVFANINGQPGGHLRLQGHAQTIGGLHDPDAWGTLDPGGATLTLHESGESLFRGAISGGGSLIKTGGGRTILRPAHSNLDGTVLVREGVLEVETPADFGTATPILSGGWLETTTSFMTNRPLVFGDPEGRSHAGQANALSVPAAASAEWTGSLNGSGPFVKTGPGALRLSGSSTHAGAVFVEEGTLHLDVAGMLDTSQSITLNHGTLHTHGNDQTFQFLGGTEGTLHTGGGGTIFLPQSLSTIFGGHLAGSGRIRKTGEANWSVARPSQNNFSGDWRIDNGRLTLMAPGSLGAGSGPIELDGGELSLLTSGTVNRPLSLLSGGGSLRSDAGTVELTWTGAISGEGGLTKTGPGLLLLTGGNTYTGLTTVAEGILRIGPASFPAGMRDLHIAPGAIFDANGQFPVIQRLSGFGTLQTGGQPVFINHEGDTHFEGVFTGGGRIVKDGPGILSLSGGNSYPAETRIANGVLQTLAEDSLSPHSLHEVFETGILDLNDHDQQIGGLIGGGGVTLGSARLTVSDANDRTFAGVLSGPGGLTKQGAGTYTLTAAQTFTGETRVEGGRLILAGANRLLAGSSVHVSAGATVELLGDHTFATLTGPGALALNGAGLQFTPAEDTTLEVSLSGSGGLTLDTPGRVTLAGSHTYTGLTEITAGILRLSAGGFPNGMSDLTLHAGSTLEVNGLDPTIASLSGAGMLSLAGGTVNLAQLTDTVFTGRITGNGLFHKYGTGVLGLGGSNEQTATMRVSHGTLRTLAADALSPHAPIEVNGAGVLDLQAFPQTVSGLFGNGTVALAGATLTLADTDDLSFVGTLSGHGTLSKIGGANWTLGGTAHDFTGEIRIEAGTIHLPHGTAFLEPPRFHVAAGAQLILDEAGTVLAGLSGAGHVQTLGHRITLSTEGEQTFTGSFGADGGLTKTGPGTLTLSGAYSWTDELRVEAGTLILQGEQILPPGLPIYVAAGATLRLVGGVAEAGGISGSGAIELDAATLRLAPMQDITLGVALHGGGGLIHAGEGALTLTSASTFTGPVLLESGTLRLGHPDALAAVGTLTLAEGAELDLNGHTLSLTNLGGAGAIRLGGGSLHLSHDTPGTFPFTLSGNGLFRKSGEGTLELTGNLTAFTGTLQIDAGQVRSATLTGLEHLLLSGGELALTATQTLDTVMTVTPGGTLRAEQNAQITLAAPLGGSGTLHLAGNGSFVPEATVSLEGGFALLGGSLILHDTDRLGAPTAPLIFQGGRLRITGELTLERPIHIGGSPNTQALITTDSNAALTLSGVLTGTGLFRKDGPGELAFDGTADSFPHLRTRLEGGTLRYGPSLTLADRPLLEVPVTTATVIMERDLTLGGIGYFGVFDFENPQGEILLVVREDVEATVLPHIAFGVGFANPMAKAGPGTLTVDGYPEFVGIDVREGDLTIRNHNSGNVYVRNYHSLHIAADSRLRLDLQSENPESATGFETIPNGQQIAITGEGTFDIGDNPQQFLRFGSGMSGDTTVFDFYGVIEGQAQTIFLPAGSAWLRGENTFNATLRLGGTTLNITDPAGLGNFENMLEMSLGTLRLEEPGLVDVPQPVILINPQVNTFETAHEDAILRISGGIHAPFGNATLRTRGPGRVEIGAPILSPSLSVTTEVESGELALLPGASVDPVHFVVQPGAYLDLGAVNTLGWLTADSDDHSPLPASLHLNNALQTGFTFDPTGVDVLALAGPGTLFLGPDNSFSGQLILKGGTVAVANEVDLGDPSRPLVFDGGVLRVEGSGFHQITRLTEWREGGGGIHVADSEHTFILPNSLTAGILIKRGPGTLVLSGQNSHPGGTEIHEGVLRFSQDTNLGGPDAPLWMYGGVLALEPSVSGAVTIHRPVAAWRSAELHVPLADQHVAFTHPVVDTYGNNRFAKTGEGTVQLNRIVFGNAGEIVVHGGKIYLEGGDHFAGFLHGTGEGRLHLLEGAMLGTFHPFNASREITLPLEGPGGLRITSNQTFQQNAAVPAAPMTYTGPTVIESGVYRVRFPFTFYPNGMGPVHLTHEGRLLFMDNPLQVGALSGGGVVTSPQSALIVEQDTDSFYGGRIVVHEFVKRGSGALQLAHSGNAFPGGLSLQGGVLATDNADVLGNETTPIVFAGGMLRILGSDLASLSNPMILGADGGGIDLVQAEHTFTLFSSFEGIGRFDKNGPGTLVLTATHAHSGGFGLQGGLVQVAPSASVGGGPLYFEGGSIHWEGGRPATLGGIGGSGDFDFGSAPLRLEQQTDTVYTGVLSGGALIKAGPATLTLDGQLNLSAPLIVESGVLTLPGGIPPGLPSLVVDTDGQVVADGTLHVPVHLSGELRTLTEEAVNLTSQLTGNGFFTGNVLLNGTTRPGPGPGALSIFGNLSLGADHTLQIDITGTEPGEGHDQLIIHGDLQLGGTLEALIDPLHAPQSGDTYEILDVSGSILGNFATLNLDELPEALAWIHLHLPYNGTLSVAGAAAVFSGWIAQFPGLDDPADREPHANPAGDGVSNLLKYVFGMDPTVASREGIPVPDLHVHPILGDIRLSLVIQLNPDAVGIRLVPEAANDLVHGEWLGGPEQVEIISQTPEQLIVIDAANNEPRRFLRLRVEAQ